MLVKPDRTGSSEVLQKFAEMLELLTVVQREISRATKRCLQQNTVDTVELCVLTASSESIEVIRESVAVVAGARASLFCIHWQGCIARLLSPLG